jgi:hypothetical protein
MVNNALCHKDKEDNRLLFFRMTGYPGNYSRLMGLRQEEVP